MNHLRKTAALVWPLLLAAALVSASLNKGFWGAHGESRRAEVAREILADGNWLVPHLHSEPFITKPPLLYWSTAATMALFGQSETSARIPAILSILIGWFVMGQLARELTMDLGLQQRPAAIRDSQCAFVATALVLAMGLNAETEAPLLILGMLSLKAWLRLPRSSKKDAERWSGRLLTGLFLAAGFMLKGPLGWIFPLLGILSWELLLPVNQRRAKTGDVFVVAGIAILLPLPWFLAVLQEVPAAMDIWLMESVSRLGDSSFEVHRESAWYYVPRLAVFLPALLWAPDLQSGTKSLGRRRLIPLTWLVSGVLFLSLASSKRTHYLLSLAPAAALMPVLAPELASNFYEKWRDRLVASFALLLPLMLMLAIWIPPSAPAGPGLLLRLTSSLACLATVLLLRRQHLPLPRLAASTLAVLLTASFSILPSIDSYRSPKTFYQEAAAIAGDAKLVNWRNDRFSASFYLKQEIPSVYSIDALRTEHPDATHLLCETKELAKLTLPARVVFSRVVVDPFHKSRERSWLLVRLDEGSQIENPRTTQEDS